MIAVCVASGPSFTEDQARLITDARDSGRCHVIAVNDNWRRVPNADVLYACDGKWWDRYVEDVRLKFTGELWTQDPDAARRHGLCHIRGVGKFGLSRERGVIHTGSNGGYQAIGLAFHFGARKILLVGYDMKHAADGRVHWFGDHPAAWGQPAYPSQWVPYFDQLHADLVAEGVEVVNCSLDTAIKVIPRGTLEVELP